MSGEENRALSHRLVEEIWNQGHVAVVDEVVASDFAHYDPTAPERRNRDDYKQWIADTLTAFPDFRVTIDDEMVDGNKVATRWTAQGTHQGDLVMPTGTVPPTGRQIMVTGITIGRYEDGKMVEDWHATDAMTFMMQLGLIPAPEQAGG